MFHGTSSFIYFQIVLVITVLNRNTIRDKSTSFAERCLSTTCMRNSVLINSARLDDKPSYSLTSSSIERMLLTDLIIVEIIFMLISVSCNTWLRTSSISEKTVLKSSNHNKNRGFLHCPSPRMLLQTHSSLLIQISSLFGSIYHLSDIVHIVLSM